MRSCGTEAELEMGGYCREKRGKGKGGVRLWDVRAMRRGGI